MNCPIHQDRIMTTKNSIDVEIYSGLPLFYCIDCEKYYISCSELEEKKVVLKNLITQKQMTIDDDKLIAALVYRLNRKELYLKEDPDMYASDEEVEQFKFQRHQLMIGI